ncbi:unnamed protein product [Ranitomeya imitator]|uniref:Myb/SANT-like DNA-binding domain-containing protein n=1 Tax=Ranitomeya imitator TaxID=111125 RepID=A0ABN9M215_9NEOB|nr:unnamed protein product [Ranitomeya imitator]
MLSSRSQECFWILPLPPLSITYFPSDPELSYIFLNIWTFLLGGSCSNDIPSPQSVMSGQNHRRKGSQRKGTEQPSSNSESPEDSYPWMEPLAEGPTVVKLESDLLSSGPCILESETCSEQEDSPGARSIRRSPNFSAAELEYFVALMDHFLPDNLIRAGAIPIRQRKSILQEIARRLEPLSGCLRTPRQLRHRWTDFNNRDPDRLEKIRSRIRRAARLESCKKLSKAAESASGAGKKWRLRRHPLQRDIMQEEQTPVQMTLDTSEEHLPRIPWHQSGLPKPRNTFSMARLKKKSSPVASHLTYRIIQQQLLQRAGKHDCAELKTWQQGMLDHHPGSSDSPVEEGLMFCSFYRHHH